MATALQPLVPLSMPFPPLAVQPSWPVLGSGQAVYSVLFNAAKCFATVGTKRLRGLARAALPPVELVYLW